MHKKILNSPFKLCLVLCISLTIIRMMLAHFTGLGYGESYYARGVIDPQLSYFDQPPLFLWLSNLSYRLLGFNGLGVRLPAVLLFFGTSLLLFQTAKIIYNEWAGFFAVLLLNTSFVFTLPIATWLQPDAPLLFFWMLSVWAFVHLFFKTERSTKKTYLWWIFLGFSIGLASLSKYHSVFLFIGIFLFILSNKKQRHWLLHPGPYLALIIHFVILIPVFYWNYQHNWVSFNFQGSRAIADAGFKLHFDWLLRSIMGQALWILPWVWFWLMKQIINSTKKQFKHIEHSFFFWLSVVPILFFTLITLWTNTEFHFHWQAPGYMIMFIPLGHFFAEKRLTNPRKLKRQLGIGTIVLVVLSSLAAIQTETGFFQYGGPDPTIEGKDFVEIKQRFEKEGWMDDETIFVGTERWWQAGKIDWVLACEKELLIFDNHPQNYAYFSHPDQLIGKDAIFVRVARNYQPKVEQYFDTVTQLENIDMYRSKFLDFTYEVFYCTNFHVPAEPNLENVIDRQLMGKEPL